MCTGCPSPSGGLSPAEAASRLTLYGRNVIEIPVAPWWVLLGREATNPFTVFQVRQTKALKRLLIATATFPYITVQIWAIAVWLAEEYYAFSMFIGAFRGTRQSVVSHDSAAPLPQQSLLPRRLFLHSGMCAKIS